MLRHCAYRLQINYQEVPLAACVLVRVGHHRRAAEDLQRRLAGQFSKDDFIVPIKMLPFSVGTLAGLMSDV